MRADVIKVRKAGSFWKRARGLLLTKHFPEDIGGLYLEPCHAVHTLGMRYDIDLIFLDKNLCILKVLKQVSPQHIFISCKDAYGVVELGADMSRNYHPGQKINLKYL